MSAFERRLLQVATLQDSPKPGKTPDMEHRGLLRVASIEEDSPSRAKESASFSSQLQNLEATFENLLNQTASSMRKDMSTREERISRRLETERKEHQQTLFDLRRDLALQQTADLAAHEERLSHRLDDEKREHKAALAELRHDVKSQEDMRAQLTALRKELAGLQASIARIPRGIKCEGQQSPEDGLDAAANKPWEQATAAVEAAVADLRREMVSQREQLRVQATASESRLSNLRKELLTLQSSETNALTEQLHRNTADFSHTVQEVSATLETTGSSLRAEMRREVERLGAELQTERAQAEQRAGLGEARGSVVAQRLEAMEQSLQDIRRVATPREETNAAAALEARVEAVEVSCRNIVDISSRGFSTKSEGDEELDTLRVSLDQTRAVAAGAQREITRLAKELELQQQQLQAVESKKAPTPAAPAERPTLSQDQIQQLSLVILKEVSRLDQRLQEELLAKIKAVEGASQGAISSCRAALEEASRSIGHITQDVARERGERCSTLGSLSSRIEELAEILEQTERKVTEELSNRSAPSVDVGDSASNVTAGSHKALGGGMISSAEHVALAACVGELDAELRMEIQDHMEKVVGELRQEIAGRVGAVEVEFTRLRGGHDLNQVESRLSRLESSRLDLRLGALETAWQRATSFMMTGRQADVNEPREPEEVVPRPVESSCGDEAQRKIQHLREMLQEQADRLCHPEITGLDIDRQSNRGHLLNRNLQLPLQGAYTPRDPAGCEASSEAAEMSEASTLHAGFDHEDMQVALRAREEQQAAEAWHDDGYGPVISDDLKERLEVLVQQVKNTLDRSENPVVPEVPSMMANDSHLPSSGNSLLAGESDNLQAMDAQGHFVAMGQQLERRISRVTVGPPVLKSVTIRRQPSPSRGGSVVMPVSGPVTTTTTTRIRSPSPVRRTSASALPRVLVSPLQPITVLQGPQEPASTPSRPGGNWMGAAAPTR